LKLAVRNLRELDKLDLTHPYGTRKSNDNIGNCQLILEVSHKQAKHYQKASLLNLTDMNNNKPKLVKACA